MLDNELEENEEQSGVEQEVSQEPQVDSQEESEESQETKPQASEEEKPLPFNEHPRWKEMIEQRNAERQAREQLQAQIAEMQKKFEESLKPKDQRPDFNQIRTKMAERLKGIDPEFQAYMSALEEQALSAKEELQAFREEQFVNRAVSRFDELTKADSVPTELASLYRSQLDQQYREGKIRSMEDLEKAYKSIHEPMKQFLESQKKSHLDEYVKTKKTDAAKPAQQSKGKPALPSKGRKTFENDQQRRAALVSDIVTEMRASNDLG
jgi:hypothetical protein